MEGHGVAGFAGPFQELEPVGLGVGVGCRLEATAVGLLVVAVEAGHRRPIQGMDRFLPEMRTADEAQG